MSEQSKVPFVREPRYVVIKLKDIAAYLDDTDCDAIQRIGEDIATARRHDGKPPFNAVVVEQDWPEFDLVWLMIEKRMTGAISPIPERRFYGSEIREMLRSMQSGELTVSRGVELVDMWLAGNYSNDQLPPARNELGEDEMPWDRITAIERQRDYLLTATQSVVERWDTPLWKDVPATAGYINTLRDAIAKVKS